MKPLSLTIMKDEHQALAAMLKSMPLLLAQWQREGQAPDFGLLRAMLFYIDEFPERLHHTKESELLFPALRARSPGSAATRGSSTTMSPSLISASIIEVPCTRSA